MILLGDWAPGGVRCEVRLEGGCTLLNLEGPILSEAHGLTPVPKAGPSLFSTSVPAADGLLVCTLANNHTMDYGSSGLEMTLAALSQRGYLATGAGTTREQARRPVIISDRGVRVAIISCCEAQFGTVGRERAGVSVLGPWVHEAIRTGAEQADAVVVSVHAGAEMSPWPAPLLQDLYRSWIDAGAAVVHGHHAHIPQGFEEYRGGLIFYGLGNFAVDTRQWRDYADALWSLGADVDLSVRPPKWRLLEFELRGDTDHLEVERCPSVNGPKHAAYLAQSNRALADRELLEALWQEVAVRTYRQYYRGWLRFPARGATRRSEPVGRWLRDVWWTLLRGPRGPDRAPKASRQDHLLWHLLFECMTHSGLIGTALGILGEEMCDLRGAESNALASELMPWTKPFARP